MLKRVKPGNISPAFIFITLPTTYIVGKKRLKYIYIMAKATKKTPKEASELFHNIIKSSVSAKATRADPNKQEVKPKEKSGNITEKR